MGNCTSHTDPMPLDGLKRWTKAELIEHIGRIEKDLDRLQDHHDQLHEKHDRTRDEMWEATKELERSRAIVDHIIGNKV